MIDIDKLEAGPELDALVAEKVMGWERTGRDSWHYRTQEVEIAGGRRFELVDVEGTPKFSTDIAAAWDVVEVLAKRIVLLTNLEIFRVDAAWSLGYFCEFENVAGIQTAEGSGPTAPLAICRAALKAVGA